MQKKFLGALGMALVLMTGTMAMPVQVCAKDYQDREAILDTGFVLDTDYTLQLANPSEDISTTEIYAETDPEMAAEAISKMLGNQPIRKWDFLTEDEKLKILGLK